MENKDDQSTTLKKNKRIILTCKLCLTLFKKHRSLIGIITYLICSIMLQVIIKRWIVVILLLSSCLLVKSKFLRNVMLSFAVLFTIFVYFFKGAKEGFNISQFLGFKKKSIKEVKFNDIFIDKKGYCYFALQSENDKEYDDLLFELKSNENIEENDAKVFMRTYLNISVLDQKIGVCITKGDQKCLIGYDEKIVKLVEKKLIDLDDNILPYSVFSTLDLIAAKKLERNLCILCFYVCKKGEMYKKYKTSAIKSDHDGIHFLVNHFFYNSIGTNDNAILYIYSHEDKEVRKLKIAYEPIIEYYSD